MANVSATQAYTQLDFNSDRAGANAQMSSGNQDQAGLIWEDVDNTLGRRAYRFAENAGANTAAFVIGDIAYWYDVYARKVSTSLTDAARNNVLGVAIVATGIGNYSWFQTDGYHSGVKAGSGTFALGTKGISDSTALRTIPETNGTAPTYTPVGTALAATSGGLVAMQLHCGKYGVSS